MNRLNRPNNILIVDDAPENLSILRHMLSHQGYMVRPALSGEVAIKAVHNDPPDLILLDIVMPGMDGYEVCRILKAGESTKHIPIIFISALADTENVLQAFKEGGVDFVTKPFKVEEVLARVHTHLDLQNAIREKEESQTKLQAILDSIENTIITVDNQLRIINANKDMNSICGHVSLEEGTLKQNAATGKCPCAAALLKTIENNKPIKEYRVDCNWNGKTAKNLVLNTTPLLGYNNEPGGAVLVIRDITRLESLEKKLLERNSFSNIVGKSKPMREIYSLLEHISELDVNVLVLGESGTGKELVAEAVHHGSNRANGPLVKVNCAALSENLLESELFGHVRGAFTGAVKDRIGRCQAAEGGTLFLDEIGEISPQFQAKLLRFIEQKEFEKIGDSRTLKADVRIVAATNQDLAVKARQKLFREDLYYRLQGFVITLPPLKDRVEDIPLLANHFILAARKNLNKNIQGLSDNAVRILLEYPWPGNIRELKTAIDYACAICPGELIEAEHFPSGMFSPEALEKLARRKTDLPNRPADETKTEREQIVGALTTAGWNKAKAARLLGVSRATLYAKLEKHSIADK